ncbi:MAG TPA: cysteine hydrolase family protein [Reyranella sp.]|nr:cysteine hydrolase family protein [Reyranella sp.]
MTDALIVIDMQQGSFGSDSPRHDAQGLVARVNKLARAVRADGGAVIFIQHDGPPGDPHHPEAPGWHLLAALEVRPDDTIVRKTSCDAFLDTTLDQVLRENGVDRLIVTGCATDYCVDTTVRTALARGWPTIVPSDGHTTADRPHLSAVQIIAHHNAIWADFLAPKGPARICLCSEVLLST